jgi:hypothetical protein
MLPRSTLKRLSSRKQTTWIAPHQKNQAKRSYVISNKAAVGRTVSDLVAIVAKLPEVGKGPLDFGF